MLAFKLGSLDCDLDHLDLVVVKKYFYDHLVMSVTLLKNKSEGKVTDSDSHIESLLDQLAVWYDGYSFV